MTSCPACHHCIPHPFLTRLCALQRATPPAPTTPTTALPGAPRAKWGATMACMGGLLQTMGQTPKDPMAITSKGGGPQVGLREVVLGHTMGGNSLSPLLPLLEGCTRTCQGGDSRGRCTM